MSRSFVERIVKSFLFLMTAVGCLTLVFILAFVLWKGSSALGLSFFLDESREFGSSGGIFYQAMGTIILMVGAAVICLPFALGSVLFQSEFLQSDSRL